MTCEQIRLSLGASALGTLTPQDQAEVDRHLLDCPECAAELSELETLPPLLASLSLADALAVAPAGPAGRRRGGPLWNTRRGLAAAAAAVVLIGSGTAVLVHDGHSTRTSFTATSGVVQMDVSVSGRGRADLDIDVRGMSASERCTLVAVSTNGSREVAGTWTANAEGGWHGWATSSFPSSDLASLVLLDPDGRQLVTVPTR